ncbi:MAG: flagellar biosynthesis anti-sigma factor FlgM [Armatimonadota bacterium]|nr:flagellar biosynthesis anti-sigma factor FlgM [bacterium]
MKISRVESDRAMVRGSESDAHILPADRPKGLVSSKKRSERHLSPLEQGMVVAEEALADVPDTREDIVNDLKRRIDEGSYKVNGKDVADMMLRRLEADRIR